MNMSVVFSRLRYFLINILVGLGVALLLLAAIEISIRAFFPFPLTSMTTYQSFADVTYFHKANSLGYEVSPFGEFKPTRLEYDSEGFRKLDGGHSIKNESAVVLLGDSFVEARQVPSSETVAGILENANLRYRFINAGCSGFTTTTEFLLFKHRLAKLKPKKLYLFFSFNDYADNFWYFGGYYKQEDIFQVGVPRPEYVPAIYRQYFDQFENWIFVNSAIYGYLKHAFRNKAEMSVWKEVANSELFNDSPKNVNKSTDEMNSLERRILDFTHQGIFAMAELAKEAGVELHVLIIPLPTQVNEHEWKVGKRIFGYAQNEIVPARIYQDRLIQFFRSNGIGYTDLLPVFVKESGVNRRMFLDFDGHFSSSGNRVIASILESQLQ